MKFPFETTIGILGAGQLGYMLMEAGSPLNIKYHTLDAADAPGRFLSLRHFTGSLYDREDIMALAQTSDVLTWEIENTDASFLNKLHQEGTSIIPFPSALMLIQDKGLQKEHYIKCGIPTAPFQWVLTEEEWIAATQKLSHDGKIVAKTRTGGYDGKGVLVMSAERILSGQIPFDAPSLIERPVQIYKEISVMVAVDHDGNTVMYDPVEMVFDPKLHLVDFLICPSTLSDIQVQEAKELANRTALSFGSPGLFAIEMFQDTDLKLWVNETAPRPHNSGHHTIEAASTSQFEQLNRILTRQPLGSAKMICQAAMVNLIGPDDYIGPYQPHFMQSLHQMENVYIHLYGKQQSRPGRKMGHVTILGDTLHEVNNKLQLVKTLIQS